MHLKFPIIDFFVAAAVIDLWFCSEFKGEWAKSKILIKYR